MENILLKMQQMGFARLNPNNIKLRRTTYDENSLGKWLLEKELCALQNVAETAAWLIKHYYPTPEDEEPEEAPFDIREWIFERMSKNDVSCNFDRTWTIGGDNVDQKKFIAEIRLELSRGKATRGVSKDLISDALYVWESYKVKDMIKKASLTIAYDESMKDYGLGELKKFIEAVSSDDSERNKIHILMIQHMIWQVKRKIGGLPVAYHCLLNFFGETGAGKSYALKKLLASMYDMAYKDGTVQMLGDNREVFILQQYPIVLLEELQGADRADVNALKRIITSSTVSYRILGVNKTSSGPNMATFFSSANNRVKDSIFDPTSGRRYWELNCKPLVDFKQNWDIVNNIDYDAIWRCVDEQAQTPIIDIVDEIQEIQAKECKARTQFEIWLDDRMWIPCSESDEKNRRKDLSDIVREYNDECKEMGYKTLSRTVASKTLSLLGFPNRRQQTEKGKLTYYFFRDLREDYRVKADKVERKPIEPVSKTSDKTLNDVLKEYGNMWDERE